MQDGNSAVEACGCLLTYERKRPEDRQLADTEGGCADERRVEAHKLDGIALSYGTAMVWMAEGTAGSGAGWDDPVYESVHCDSKNFEKNIEKCEPFCEIIQS